MTESDTSQLETLMTPPLHGQTTLIDRAMAFAAGMEQFGIGFLRLGLVIVLLWIGGLKFVDYEADSIVPLVSNSPLMDFSYHYPAPQYKQYMNREGDFIVSHRQWHTDNGTYRFSHILGAVIVGLGFLIALHPIRPKLAALGSFLLVFMALTTLSFLVTTPEAWVQPLGDADHGFPFLSGTGRLLIKDSIMLGAAIVTMANSAKAYVKRFNIGAESRAIKKWFTSKVTVESKCR